MANKQIVDYIKEAESGNLKKGEIIGNLKEAGWGDNDIRDAYAYIGLYSSGPYHGTAVAHVSSEETSPQGGGFMPLASAAIGFVWIISGLNKILGGLFVAGFTDFVQGQISSGRVWSFYQSVLENFVLPNAHLVATITQYTELATGISLIFFGFWHLLRNTKALAFVLCLASVVSVGLIVNIILSQALPLPWIDTSNVFASGVSVEYLMLLLSIVSAVAYFYEL